MGLGERTTVRLRDVLNWAGPILGPDRSFFVLALIYGIGISMLSLATPVSVQMLINTIASTGLTAPLLTLASVLLFLLLVSAALSGFRTYLMEVFRRRFMARLVAETTVRAVNAQNPFFQDARRNDVFNRYFEVMTVHKSIPSLFIGGFTLVLQAGVGLLVTSFYHPFFLLFNMLVILLLWIIWKVWARSAMRTSIELCDRKYSLGHWLESVGGSDGFYKSGRHLDYAMDQSERLTSGYIDAHRDHFRRVFPQTISLYVLYAFASAGLLALGGWLVIQEQLSIGQLVAAELILAGVFFGISQLGPYLEDFYDLVASLDELSLLYAIPQEPRGPGVDKVAQPNNATLEFSNVRVMQGHGQIRFDLEIPEGSNLVASGFPGMQRVFTHLLKRHIQPSSGLATLGGIDIASLDILELRSNIIVLDRPTIVETRIVDYLNLANIDSNPIDIMKALELVGLDDRVAMLDDGLQTVLSPTGWPLSLPKTMQLKLAAAILSKPQILVLSPLFDMVSKRRMDAVLRHLADARTTVLYFTNRPEDVEMDGFLYLGREKQIILQDRAAFEALRASGGGEQELVIA